MKLASRIALLVLFASVAHSLHAQGGCVDSPEDPTLALALIGSAGVVFTTLRARRKSQSKNQQ